MTNPAGVILIVDDVEANRDLLSRRLRRQGYTVTMAENGQTALELLVEQSFDLVLLDVMMPELNGYEVLERMKADQRLRHIPVVMISALDDIESIVRCIEMGAEDYLTKPFNPVLLKARVGASLEKKRLRDQEQEYLQQIELEREKAEHLLLNVLPRPIAERLKADARIIADSFAAVTVLFADLVDFTALSSQVAPHELVELLNTIFSHFDSLAEQYGLEKIKTIGDAYMVVGGLPEPRPDHAVAVAAMALDMQAVVTELRTELRLPVALRIGMHSGPVVAGVIGVKKFSYDLWGDTVNTASRMESQGLVDAIQVSAATYELLHHAYHLTARGSILVKGKGEMQTYLLTSRRSDITPTLQLPRISTARQSRLAIHS